MKIDTNIRTYTDGRDVVHRFDFTIGSLRKLKREHGIDLLDNSDGSHYTLQMSDERFLEIVAILLGVDADSEFFDELDGPRFAALSAAFWGALGFFFQTANQTKWQVIQKEWAKSTETIQKIQEYAIEHATSQSGKKSVKLLDTSESTPNTTRSAS